MTWPVLLVVKRSTMLLFQSASVVKRHFVFIVSQLPISLPCAQASFAVTDRCSAPGNDAGAVGVDDMDGVGGPVQR